MTAATTFNVDAFNEILVSNLGVDDEALDGDLTPTLADLGVDSIGVLELQTIVRDQYAVVLPDHTDQFNLGEIIDFIAAALNDGGK